MTDVTLTVGELDPPANPYVGPQALGPQDTIYGRLNELNELRDILIARRIVLLYSPSGAGKSSLLEGRTGLRSELEHAGFEVPRTVRVSHEDTQIEADSEPRTVRPQNRYVWSVLSSLEETRPTADRVDAALLGTKTIDDYLTEREALDGNKVVCVFFDQFEELFTLDPTDYDAKEAFLGELGAALRNESRWAVFSMREDFIALLDPYLSKIPTRLSTRFRLDLLEESAAIAAARGPSEDAGVPFAESAARQLVNDLRKVKVLRRGTLKEGYGRYVEPVQLQVVCRQLWDDVHRRARDVVERGEAT